MGNIAQRSLRIALDSYFQGSNSKRKVHELSEEPCRLEDDVGDIAVELVARYQPVAKDLRFIHASREIAYIIWRFGRYSNEIINANEALPSILNCEKTKVLDMSCIVRKVVESSLLLLRMRDKTTVKPLYEPATWGTAHFIWRPGYQAQNSRRIVNLYTTCTREENYMNVWDNMYN